MVVVSKSRGKGVVVVRKGKAKGSEIAVLPERDKLEVLPEATIDLGNLDHSEARNHTGWRSSRRYQKQSVRVEKNIDGDTGVERAAIEALRVKIERLIALKEFYKEAGLIDQLPEKDRLEFDLEIAELRTELMRKRKETAELERDIRGLDTEPVLEALERIEDKLDSTQGNAPKKLTGIDAVVQESVASTKDMLKYQRAMDEALAGIDQETNPEAYERIESIWEDRMLKLLETGK